MRGPEEMRIGMAESFGFSSVIDEASATFLSWKAWRELGAGDVRRGVESHPDVSNAKSQFGFIVANSFRLGCN
jgi:hypothetical protein